MVQAEIITVKIIKQIHKHLYDYLEDKSLVFLLQLLIMKILSPYEKSIGYILTRQDESARVK